MIAGEIYTSSRSPSIQYFTLVIDPDREVFYFGICKMGDCDRQASYLAMMTQHVWKVMQQKLLLNPFENPVKDDTFSP